MAHYVVPDIHGQFDELRRVHALIAADRARTGEDGPVVHLGDLVDRGPDSAGVVDYLLRGPKGGLPPWITLRGNHDFMFRLFLKNPALRDPGLNPAYDWGHERLGGRATLRSYGVDAPDDRPLLDLGREARDLVPAAHRVFLDNLPLLHRTEWAVFVHAGIRPGVPLIAQEPTDLMWIRKGWLDAGPGAMAGMPLVVHGHTVVDQPSHHGHRVNLDTGAGYGEPLIAAVVEGRDIWLLTEDGREPLLPGGPAHG